MTRKLPRNLGQHSATSDAKDRPIMDRRWGHPKRGGNTSDSPRVTPAGANTHTHVDTIIKGKDHADRS